MRDINLIVVHCSATKPSQDISAADVDRWHKAKGWIGIGYHYFVKLDGTLELGRPEDITGAHAKGNNAHSIGVCYAGGIDANGKPEDTRTELQRTTLVNLLKDLRSRFPNAQIVGHRDLKGVAKACPSFNAKDEYAWI